MRPLRTDVEKQLQNFYLYHTKNLNEHTNRIIIQKYSVNEASTNDVQQCLRGNRVLFDCTTEKRDF